MPDKKSLKMSFEPRTIEHLGVKMYSNIPNAVAELIANAYDADAVNVEVKLFDDANGKSIEVHDDGNGMDFDEINEKFLKIGRDRRAEGEAKSQSGKRKATGKKGLGKLALFGLGEVIEITTIKKGSGQKITFELDWNKLMDTQGSEYEPKFKIETCDKSLKGTSIVLNKLKRRSAFDIEDMATSLSKLFNLFDKNFKVYLSLNGKNKIQIDEKLKYKNIKAQFKWTFPNFFKNVDINYKESGNISGEIISTEKPLKPAMRGITLFANGRLVNEPEFFGVAESSHGFSYFTGWLNIDFIDDLKEDVISTNRQSLNWDLPKTIELREFLKRTLSILERDWKIKRTIKRREEIKEEIKVDIPGWYDKLPKDILSKVESIVNAIVEDSELSGAEQSKVVKQMHGLVPEYPHYHWRHLHPEIQNAAEAAYLTGDYYTAFAEAAKRYINTVKTKSKSTVTKDFPMMGQVFGREPASLLHVAKKYKKPDGTDFTSQTRENIEDGQKHLSMGIVAGARNPVAHEESKHLSQSKLFTEKDCLDALSLLSHLFRRLDDAQKP